MGISAIFWRVRRDERGAAAVEFALVSGAFFMMMFGIIEYGMIMLTKVAIESAVVQVSRAASIGTVTGNDIITNTGCTDRVCAVKWLVQQKTLGLVRKESVIVTATVISAASTASPAVPDVCLDNVINPYPASCLGAHVNNDGVDGYQQTAGINAASIGVAGDLVEIRVSYLWRVLFPLFQSYFTIDGLLPISSSTVIKNEPF